MLNEKHRHGFFIQHLTFNIEHSTFAFLGQHSAVSSTMNVDA